MSILGVKSENKKYKKEKIKKIVDILLNLDNITKDDCLNYMNNTTAEDEKKNNDLFNIINKLIEEEKKE